MMDYKSEIQELKRKIVELQAQFKLFCEHKNTLTNYEVGSGAPFDVYCSDCGKTLKENV